MLDAMIDFVLNKIIQNSQFKKKVSLEQKEDRFLQGKHIAFLIYDCNRVTDAHDTILDEFDFSVFFSMMTIFRNLMQNGIGNYNYRPNFHPMKSWKVCTN